MSIRRRYIDPEFWASESIGDLSYGARLLFMGLWCCADREGRLRWRPAVLRGQLFPHDDAPIEEWGQELERHGLIRLYGDRLCCIPNFLEYQKIHPKEAASKLPDPEASGGFREVPGSSGELFPASTSTSTSGSLVTSDDATPARDPIKEQEREVIQRSNEITGRKWRESKNLRARLREGFTVDQLVAAVEHRHAEWSGDDRMDQYIRPTTIFGKEKAPGYVEAAERWIRDGRPYIGPDATRGRISARHAASREAHQETDEQRNARRKRQAEDAWHNFGLELYGFTGEDFGPRQGEMT